MPVTLDELAVDVKARLEALKAEQDEALSDQALKHHIRSMLDDFIESDEGKDYVRKVRWGAPERAPELVGTKYARMGLTKGDIEILHAMTTAAYQRGYGPGPSEELDNTFKAISDGCYRSTALARAEDEAALTRAYERGQLDIASYQRAMDTLTAGEGAQLMGVQFVADMWEAARRECRVFNLIDSFEMKQNITTIPVEVDIPPMLLVGESIAPAAAPYATSVTHSRSVNVQAQKLVIHQIYSGELNEDSIIPYLPFLRRQAGLSMQFHLDSLVLNGDVSPNAPNINSNDAAPAANSHWLAFDGLRHVFLIDNPANGLNQAGPITWNALNRIRNRMIDDVNLHDWGNPSQDNDLVYVADPRSATEISMLDEVITVDKYGSNATVLTGEISKIGRHPLVVSQALRLTTAAAGTVSVAAPATNVCGTVVAFNRNAYKTGWRRHVQLESEKIIGTDQYRLMWSLRLGFARFTPTGAALNIESSAGIWGIALP